MEGTSGKDSQRDGETREEFVTRRIEELRADILAQVAALRDGKK